MGQKWHSWCAPQTVRYRVSRPRKGKEEMISPRRQMTEKEEELERTPTVGRQLEGTEAFVGEGLERSQGELGGA